ncbi:MAG TPA: TIGR01777 family oxidoreductase [Candidatus Binatia bacterium]
MRVVVAGGSGFIGSVLCPRLVDLGHSLVILSRSLTPTKALSRGEWMQWNPGESGTWERAVNGADAVINLAGEPIPAKRWSAAQKKKIRTSRVNTTRALVKAIERAEHKPRLVLNASAIGYYGPRGDDPVTEESPAGDDFVSRVCREWEAEAQRAEALGVRVVRLRTGIVLGRGGGALAKMVFPFRLFIGGPLGTGTQWVSWIQMEDEVGLILHLLQHATACGAVNATAPHPVTNRELSRTLGRVLRRPSWAPVPAFALRILLGEMADMVLTGQRVLPAQAQQLGYRFKYTDLAAALRASV